MTIVKCHKLGQTLEVTTDIRCIEILHFEDNRERSMPRLFSKLCNPLELHGRWQSGASLGFKPFCVLRRTCATSPGSAPSQEGFPGHLLCTKSWLGWGAEDRQQRETRRWEAEGTTPDMRLGAAARLRQGLG